MTPVPKDPVLNLSILILQWALFMGMEHERIHIETSSVLIRHLPVHRVEKPRGWTYGPMGESNNAGW